MSEPPRTLAALGQRFGPRYRWYVTITAIIGTLSTVLASTIVNVALPDVMGAFGIGQDHAQLLSTGFLAAVTGTMLLNAWMTETFGHRGTYAMAVGMFLAGSALAGLAPNEGLLITGRVLQGASAGLMQPLGTQIIFQVFPPAERGSAMGIAAVGIVLAPAIGPTLGGVMVDGWGWRSVFFLSVPPALLGLALAMVFMPDRDPARARRGFDGPGFLLLIGALLAFFTGLSSGQRFGWGSPRVTLELALAALLGLGFVLWEWRCAAPLLDPRVFRNAGFAGAFAVALVYGASIFGTTYLVPLFVQTAQGYSATRAGLVMMPAGMIMLLVFPVAGRLADRLAPWQPMALGLVMFALSCWLLRGVDTDVPFWTLALRILIGRVGLGLTMPSMNAGALRALPPRFLGQGAGGINFARQFGGAIGVNLLSIALEQRGEATAQALTAAQDGGGAGTLEYLRMVQGLLAEEGVPVTELLPGAYEMLGRVIAGQAGVVAFRESFLFVALACLLAVLPALALRRPRATA